MDEEELLAMRYGKTIHIPGCSIDIPSSTKNRLVMNCHVEMILTPKGYEKFGKGIQTVKAIIEDNKISIEQPESLSLRTVNTIKTYIKKYIEL